MAKTLKLDPDKWDLVLDGSGDIAVESGGEALAQDVASACLTFNGEVWFDNTLGIPWRSDVLGHQPPPGFIQSKMEAEAMKVTGVVAARTLIYFDKDTRQTRGMITMIDTNSQEVSILL
ncbi:hypothetical protein [Serratia proteamaculans]|uniref:hypothetical protein n=1 Tax=Serratia proteamaculans TaxID=28151 RepID=UPI00217C42F6|nr:hypothetical protein [Serratia proteamaculans]CAI1172469.1 Uncharacterised protein [Serratia proteamaculans]